MFDPMNFYAPKVWRLDFGMMLAIGVKPSGDREIIEWKWVYFNEIGIFLVLQKH